MALNLDYVARETGTNLIRNPGLTVASILTVVVALTMVGTSFLIQEGVNNATLQWRGDIEVIMYLEPKIEPAQLEAIRNSLEQNPGVKRIEYFDKNAAYEEFKKLFKDNPQTIEAVTPDVLPTSFRIVPVNADSASVTAIERTYEKDPGVYDIVSATRTIREIEKLTSFFSATVKAAALILGITAAVLIFNTIRMAMFARRREIEVMKLVGATNWFIRVPFMFEGMIQGLLGSLLSVGLLNVLYNQWSTKVGDDASPTFLSKFQVGFDHVMSVSIWMVIIGVVASSIFSGIAASRYLDV